MIPFDPFDPRPSADRLDPFITTGTALLVAGIVGAGTSAATGAYAAHKQGEAADKAAALETASSDKQLDFQKEQAARDQANWERTMQFNVDQYNQKEARLAPFRNIGTNANATLSSLIGGRNVTPLSYVPPPAQLPPMAPPPGAPAGPAGAGPVAGGQAPPQGTLSRVMRYGPPTAPQIPVDFTQMDPSQLGTLARFIRTPQYA